jgi:hypothetical protein
MSIDSPPSPSPVDDEEGWTWPDAEEITTMNVVSVRWSGEEEKDETESMS